jgi:protoporphyrinogen oxidase
MDLGGHRFFTKNEQVQQIWQKLMPLQGAPSLDDILLERTMAWSADGPDPQKEDRVFLLRNRVSRIYYLKKFFDYPITLNVQTLSNMGLVRTVKAGWGYLAAVLHKHQENSLEDFYINRFGRPLYEMFFEDYTEKLWGIHPSRIAPDWGAQRVKGLSLFKVLTSFLTKPFTSAARQETSLIEEFHYPKFGPGQFWETMAVEIGRLGGQIIFDNMVEKLDCLADGSLRVQARNKNGEKIAYSASAVFSSMPVKDLIAAMDDRPPLEVSQIASALPYRDFITVGLLLNKLLIKNETKLKTLANIVPDCWIYIQEREVKLGRLQIFNNWSPYLVSKPEENVWMGLEYFCNEGDEKWNMRDEDFIKFAIDELVKIGVISPDDVLDATMLRVKKAYPAYFGSYQDFPVVRNYLNTINNLYCIGRNGQHRYNNMDHSMLTAIEAVNCYLHKGENKEAIWNVNAEEQYHETKSG